MTGVDGVELCGTEATEAHRRDFSRNNGKRWLSLKWQPALFTRKVTEISNVST